MTQEQFDKMLAAAKDIVRHAGDPPGSKCSRCGGTGVVDDGEIDCDESGEPFMNGPIKCVKDCPACNRATPPPLDPLTVEWARSIVAANTPRDDFWAKWWRGRFEWSDS